MKLRPDPDKNHFVLAVIGIGGLFSALTLGGAGPGCGVAARTFSFCGFSVASDETAAASFVFQRKYPNDHQLRLNHVQVKGTHNSYHLRPLLPVTRWAYSHAPLDHQLECQGVRQLELDLHWHGPSRSFRVFHRSVWDARSNCRRFRDCLGLVKKWSDARRWHLPIMVFLQPKQGRKWSKPAARLRRLENVVRAVWPRHRVITPDEVRGSHSNLRQAVTRRGWPTLAQVRGRVMFVLFTHGRVRRVYTHGGRHLRGRLFFATGTPGKPYVAVASVSSPRRRSRRIVAAVRAGLLVRTRADAKVNEAQRGDYRRLRAALDSGAQVIATDFPAPVRRYRYVVRIPGGRIARCNPHTAPAWCAPEHLE